MSWIENAPHNLWELLETHTCLFASEHFLEPSPRLNDYCLETFGVSHSDLSLVINREKLLNEKQFWNVIRGLGKSEKAWCFLGLLKPNTVLVKAGKTDRSKPFPAIFPRNNEFITDDDSIRIRDGDILIHLIPGEDEEEYVVESSGQRSNEVEPGSSPAYHGIIHPKTNADNITGNISAGDFTISGDQNVINLANNSTIVFESVRYNQDINDLASLIEDHRTQLDKYDEIIALIDELRKEATVTPTFLSIMFKIFEYASKKIGIADLFAKFKKILGLKQ